MPFDLDRSTHRFEKRMDGLRQTVVAGDHNDAQQIGLIGNHLRAESEKFGRGEFDDPATIHGDSMPAIEELRRHDRRPSVQYLSIDSGATPLYRSDDPVLIEALHRWADAQVADHGEHAEHGPTTALEAETS